MIALKNILLSWIFLFVFACGPKSLISYKSEVFQESKTFRTYSIGEDDITMVDKDSLFINDRMKWIRSAIRHELEKRGYRESVDPDVQIEYYLFVKDRQELKSIVYGTGSTYANGGVGYYNTKGIPAGNYVDYKDGTLVVDIIDLDNQAQVWQCVAGGSIKGRIKDPEETISNIMADVFLRYDKDVEDPEK